MKKVIKIVGYAVAAFVGLAILVAIFGDDKKTVKSKEVSTPTKPKEWVTVDSVIGNGKMQSANFYLGDGEKRLAYAYLSEDAEIGNFGVYILKKGHDLSTQGGFPEVSISKTKVDNQVSYFNRPAGYYFLTVVAMGDYKIYIQELK